jgi:hypothetical protein
MTTFNTRVTFDHVRNTAAGFTAANPVLGYGVIGLETDTGRSKVGDGVAAWTALPYSGGGPVEWANVQGKPSTFAPSAHQHPISDVNGLQAALDSKATPAQVTAAVAAVVDAAPGTLDTLNELAAALGDDANFASTVTNALAAKAPLASPTFTGTVSGITKAMVGLGNVDNTADAAKPVSTATQTALDGKASTTDARLSDAREWSAATVTQAEAEAGTSTSRLAFSPLRVFQAVAAWWAASSAKTKLDGISAGATANATDAQLRDRATHTGTQAHTTITGLGGAATLNVGTTAGTVAAGDDSRLSDQRVPTDGSVTDAKIASTGLSTSSLNWAAIQPWAANTAYAKGDLVSNAGIAYRRSAAGTSGATFNTANWQQITPSTFDGSQIASGTVATARLGSGTASNTTFLRGDQSYAPASETFLFTRSSAPASASGSNGSYTWTIPSTAKMLTVDCIAAGGGGGSGRRWAAGNPRGGGGGGGPGGRSVFNVPVSELPSLGLSIAVGAGGAGGAAVTANDTNGNAGSTGGVSQVTITSNAAFLAIAWAGMGGGAGAASGGAGGGNQFSNTFTGGSGGAGGVTAAGSNSGFGAMAASGGGGGGGISSGDVAFGGGSSSGAEIARNTQGSAAGGAVGAAGAAGGSSAAGGSGAGGGGGGASTTAAAGAGGNGAAYGGGGGGGGASVNGFNSGAGGNGGDGVVRITVWY